jgi:phosphoglycolate phosphatase-like HAD superfamily hydrolase
MMRTEMIKILLDVDGVLNASNSGWSRAPKSGNAFADGNSWRMRWEPEVMDRITKLNNTPNIEVLWATTWVGHTRQLENLFKLPALLSAGSRAMSIDDKQTAALEIITTSTDRLIWIDDQAIPLSGDLYDQLIKEYGRVLLIRPASSRGLRPEHFDQIDKFVNLDMSMSNV